MNIQKISGVILLLLLVSNTAIAGPQIQSFQIAETNETKAQVTADKWIEATKNKLADLEKALKDNDPKSVYKIVDFKDTMHSIFSADFISYPEYQAFKYRILELRKEYNLRGVNTGTWKDWYFDGLPLTDKEINLIKEIEAQINVARSLPYTNPKVVTYLNNITETLTSPEFSSNPVLKYYKENLGLDLLQGAKYKNNLDRITKIAGDFRGFIGRVQIKNRIQPIDKEYAIKLVKEIDEVKNSGFDLKDFKIKSDDKDPLSKEFTLEQIRKRLINL